MSWGQRVKSLEFKLMLKGLGLPYSRMTSVSQGGFAGCPSVIINSAPFHSQVSCLDDNHTVPRSYRLCGALKGSQWDMVRLAVGKPVPTVLGGAWKQEMRHLQAQ